MSWSGGQFHAHNILLGFKIKADMKAKKRVEAQAAMARMAQMCQKARETLCKPSEILPTASQSSPAVLGDININLDPYGCEIDNGPGYFGPTEMRLLDIEHLKMMKDPYAGTGEGGPNYLEMDTAKHVKDQTVAAFKITTDEGTIYFPYGSLAYDHICQMVNVRLYESRGASEPYDPEPSFVTFPMTVPVLDRISGAALECKRLLGRNKTAVPASWYNHMIYLADEVAKMHANLRLFTASLERQAASELVETPILTKTGPGPTKTRTLTKITPAPLKTPTKTSKEPVKTRVPKYRSPQPIRPGSAMRTLRGHAKTSSPKKAAPELVETPILTKTAPELVETPILTKTAPELVETPILTKTAPKLVKTPTLTKMDPITEVTEKSSSVSEKMSELSVVEKMSFAAVAAIKPPTAPTVPRPAPEPIEIELRVPFSNTKPMAVIKGKLLTKKEPDVDAEGFRTPKKSAPKMELVPHKVFPIGTSSSSSDSSDTSESSRQPSVKSDAPQPLPKKIVLNLTEEENKKFYANVRRDKTREKLNRRVIERAAEREAAKKAKEEAKRQEDADLKLELMKKLADYKEHLNTGRLQLRSDRNELCNTDRDEYLDRLRQLSAFDQSVMIAFTDKPRPSNTETLAAKYIAARLEIWTAKNDEAMIRYWSVLASEVNAGIRDDIMYMRKLLFLYKISDAEKERYDRVYMGIVFEGDRRSRLECSLDSFVSEDPLINLDKVREYVDQRLAFLRDEIILSKEEVDKLGNMYHFLYEFKDRYEPCDPIEMTEIYIQWRGLTSSHSQKKFKEWSSAFNFMTRNPHVVFATDLFMILNMYHFTNTDEGENENWVKDFEEGNMTTYIFLRYIDCYMSVVFGIGN